MVLRRLTGVRQTTINPVITGAAVAQDTLAHTDECNTDARLPAWGQRHKTVCDGRGEYALDEDGEGFLEFMSTPLRVADSCCAPGAAQIEALAGQVAILSRLRPNSAQRTLTRQSSGRRPYRGPGR